MNRAAERGRRVHERRAEQLILAGFTDERGGTPNTTRPRANAARKPCVNTWIKLGRRRRQDSNRQFRRRNARGPLLQRVRLGKKPAREFGVVK